MRAPILWRTVLIFWGAILGLSCLSCSGGQKWVADFPSPVSDASETRIITAEEEAALWEDPRGSQARPRLSEVTTLGEIDLPSSEYSEQYSATSPVPPVVVNVNNYVSASSGGWAPYYGRQWVSRGVNRSGYSTYRGNLHRSPSDRSTSDRSTSERPRSETPRIGGDWPAVPDHGPSFPLKSAPAQR